MLPEFPIKRYNNNMKKIICIFISLLCFGLSFAQSNDIVEGEYLIDDYKIEINSNGNINIISYKGTDAEVVIPDNFDGYPVVSLGAGAFNGNTKLKSVVIPSSVKEIDRNVFYYCINLQSVTLGNSIEEIGYAAFYHCESLTTIVIPDSVVSIGGSSFFGCNKLQSVVIGDNVKFIYDDAFRSCSSLTSIIIPDSVTEISYSAFAWCEKLTTVTIGKNVRSLNCSSCFSECPLAKITLTSAGTELLNVPENVEIIKPKAKSLKEQMAERKTNN